MAMTLPAGQSENNPLYFKNPVSWKPPYFLQPCVSAATDTESVKESSVIANFYSAVDRLSTTSLDLRVTECQPLAANELAGNSSASPCSNTVRSSFIPVLCTEIAEGDRGSLRTLAMMNTIESTETANILQGSEELTNDPPKNVPYSGRFDVSYQKDGDTPPFRKWMRSFRRKEPKRRAIVCPLIEDGIVLKDEDATSNMPSSKTGTKTPSSSMRFVTAVKTASNTFASLSIAGGSARRKSSGGTLDDATVMRMRDRRCALEELINTEEYYIADLKVLVNVSFFLHDYSCFFMLLIFIEHNKLYFSALNDCECISTDIKDAIKRNVSEILDLHESLLSDIFRVLPAASHQIQNYKGKFLDISPQVGELEKTHILSNPDAALKVAEVFDKMVGSKG